MTEEATMNEVNVGAERKVPQCVINEGVSLVRMLVDFLLLRNSKKQLRRRQYSRIRIAKEYEHSKKLKNY